MPYSREEQHDQNLSDKRSERNPTDQTGKGRNQPFQGLEKSHSTMTIFWKK